MSTSSKKAIVLLSGGLDSSTTLAIASAEGYDCHAMSFRYGQKHHVEITAAQQIAAAGGVAKHIIVDIDLAMFGGSALTADIEVPKDRDIKDMSSGIPVTYVPARNTIFLSYALAWAEVLPAFDIFIGVNALDYSGYPDCRPEYISAFQKMANLATRSGVEGSSTISIRTPLLEMTKSQIIERGRQLGVDYSLTTTCYDPDAAGRACGACDACLLRLKGFENLGLSDPVEYQNDVQR